jgi:DNA-binding MarR family transcriptional regulator
MMKKGNDIANLIANLRNRANAFIMTKLEEEGITELVPSHGAILVALYENGPQPMKAICERVNRDKSTLTVLVRKLEALDYVRREPDEKDNRSTILHLTEKGIAFRSIFDQISGELRRRMWGDATDDEREVLCRQLDEMTRRLEA